MHKEELMGYMDLLKAHRRSGKPPTIERTSLSKEQMDWANQGLCIKCGKNIAAACNYICTECQNGDTIEDIRKEIAMLRRRLLGRPAE